MRKYLFFSSTITFLVIFNFGYVFHDLIMGEWFHNNIGNISRDHYIIPVIAIAFIFYSVIQTYLFPIFYSYTSLHYNWGPLSTGIVFGGLLGFLWDGLQGGMIEYATFKMPLEVFVYDSAYHVFEGCLTGFIVSRVYLKTIKYHPLRE